MKQVKLAQQLGVSKSYLSMILSGQRKCPPELAQELGSLGVVNFKAGLLLKREVPLTPRRMRQHGWGRRIRTSADGSRVHSPTARRSPNDCCGKNSH